MIKQKGKKMKLLKSVVLLGLIFTSNVIAEEWTETKPVDAVQISSSIIYFKNESGWGASGCPTAKFIYVQASEAYANHFLQLGLAAKSNAGLELQARGTCGDENNFIMDYLKLVD